VGPTIPERENQQPTMPAIGRHDVALIAMERRRVDVLWALLRDNRPVQTEPPVPRPA
jgi:hypothetical protein